MNTFYTEKQSKQTSGSRVTETSVATASTHTLVECFSKVEDSVFTARPKDNKIIFPNKHNIHLCTLCLSVCL